MGPSPAITRLRAQIRALESGPRLGPKTLKFAHPAIDAHLPAGGLSLSALHEIGTAHSAAILFTAGILARLRGQVLWCLRNPHLFAPGLAAAGLAPDRVIYVEARTETDLLTCFEEGLRHGGLACVVAEIGRLPLTASRRLQLAAEASGTLAIAIRPCVDQPSAAATRWRVSVLPSPKRGVPGMPRQLWRVELLRCRGGEPAEFEVEACDAKGYLAVPAGLADRAAGVA